MNKETEFYEKASLEILTVDAETLTGKLQYSFGYINGLLAAGVISYKDWDNLQRLAIRLYA